MFSWRKLRKTRSSLFAELNKKLTDYSRLQQGSSDGTTRWARLRADLGPTMGPSLTLSLTLNGQRQIFNNSFLIVVLLTSSLSSESLNFLIATISPVSKRILSLKQKILGLYLYYGLSRRCHRLLLQLSQAFHTYLIELYGIVRSEKACFAFSKLISKFPVFQPTNNNLEHLHP